MKESQFVLDLKKWLNKQPNCLALKIHGSQFQEAGLPDIISCINGRFVGIEGKIGNNKLTKIQSYQLSRIEKAGGISLIVNDKNFEDIKKQLSLLINDELKQYLNTRYWISKSGKVYSKWQSEFKEKTPTLHPTGYMLIHLFINGISKTKRIHRLVAECFLDNPENLPEINHKDRNPSNNHVSNLEWCNRETNLNYWIQPAKENKPLEYYQFLNQYDILIWNRYHIFSNGEIYSELSNFFIKPYQDGNYFVFIIYINKGITINIAKKYILNNWDELESLLNEKKNKKLIGDEII